MTSSDPNIETSELVKNLYENLSLQIHKSIDKYKGKPIEMVLTALQNATINFFGAITGSCAEANNGIINQLEYIEIVRRNMDKILNIIKKKIMDDQLN